MKEKDIKSSPKKRKEDKKKSEVHKGHRERMKSRFRQTGFKGMHEHEMLEMLLYYSIPRKDTNPIAHALIDRFGSLVGVLEASEDQLLQVNGITENSTTLIKMMLPILHQYTKESTAGKRLFTPDESGKFLCEYYTGVMNERVTVICLDASCKIVAFEPICDGDVGNCVLNFRRLVEIVLKYPTTNAVIIAHNHPGGLALPSHDDVVSTNELVKSLKNMNIPIVDHIIVAGGDYVSMASSAAFKSVFNT